jgi:hypothetical protein
MKKLLALFCIMFLVAIVANAADPAYNSNGTVTSTPAAQFNTTVIEPLTIDGAQADLTLPPVVNGYPRTFGATDHQVHFLIDGAKSQLLTIVGHDIATTDGITITGTWDNPAGTNEFGHADIVWTCTGVSATGATHGAHTLVLTVDVSYTSI